jgi:hypothetical protein
VSSTLNGNRPQAGRHVRHRRTIRAALLAGAVALAWAIPATALAGVGADAGAPVAADAAAPLAADAGAAPAALPPLLPGEVVTLLGNRPELWVTDEGGALHFASDTRALAGRTVDWSFRLQVSVEQLRGLPQGDPWLSTAMLASGDTIFQPRWDTLAATPTLYRLQAASDLPLYGITAENYTTYVLPAAEWEQRYGFRVAALPQVPAAPLVDAPPAPPAPPATPVPPPPAAPTATPAAAAATAVPAAPTATSPGAATTPTGLTPVPTTPPGTLTHAPVYGPTGDVYFPLPAGHDWRDASNAVAPLTQLSPTGMLQGERILGIWRRTYNDAPYVYLQFDAVDLNFHPEIKTVTDLANLKMGFLRRDSETAQVGSLLGMTAGGQPAEQADSVWGRRFPGGPGQRGQPSASDINQWVTQHNSNDPVSELLWTERDVFVLRGNWGYVFRLYSTGPGQQSANRADLDQVLASLTFRY